MKDNEKFATYKEFGKMHTLSHASLWNGREITELLILFSYLDNTLK